MINNKITVGITQGDGNGIGYEVIIKALADQRILDSFTPVIYGSSKVFGFYRKLIHNLDPLDTYVINSAKEARLKKINILNCLPDNIFVEPGQSTPESAKSAITSLERAVADLKAGDIDVLVTAPINKRAMSSAGFGFTGHTEYLKKEFGVSDVAMFMISEHLKIGVVTGHIPLKDVPSSISKEKILTKLRLMDASLRRDFGVTRPKIAVLGLNPHCGENGLFGREEIDEIIPVMEAARAEGIHVEGPVPPDTIFSKARGGWYDMVVAMYHDQGHIPLKLVGFVYNQAEKKWDAVEGVNITLGLPIVRTSVDHGTAFDQAGLGIANELSLVNAIHYGIRLAKSNRKHRQDTEGKNS